MSLRHAYMSENRSKRTFSIPGNIQSRQHSEVSKEKDRRIVCTNIS